MVKIFKFVLSAAAVMSAMFACTKAEISEIQENNGKNDSSEEIVEVKVPMTIIAGIDENEGESTKLLLDGLKFNWKAGDEIAIIGFSNADGSKFDPTPYTDADHIFPSDLVKHKYIFTAGKDGNSNVPFSGTVDENVTLLYAVYPASALHDDDYIAESTMNEGVGYGGKIHYKNTTDGNIDGDAILVCNFLKRGKWQFSCPSTIFKINVDEGLGVTDIVLRRDNCEKDQGIVGKTTFVWYRQFKSDKTSYEGHIEAASSGNEYDLHVTRNGDVISGDVYFVTRPVGKTGVAHLLKFETNDGKVGFASKTFTTAPSSKLVNLGDIKADNIPWYDTEVIDYQFLDTEGKWIGGEKLFGEYVDGSTNDSPEARVFRGNDHDLALVSNGYTLRLHSNSTTSATDFGGIRLRGDDLMGPVRIGFPAIKGMKLYQADVTYHTSYKASIVDDNQESISVSCKNAGDTIEKTLGGTPTEAEAKEKTYTYDLLGTPGAGWGGTDFGKMYWLMAAAEAGELRISGIKLHYIGEQVKRADCVKTLDGRVFNTNLSQEDVNAGETEMRKTITMNGQFVPRNFTDIEEDYEYGFDFKVVDADELWTEAVLSNQTVTLNTETGIATFSADAAVPNLDFYEFRAKVRVKGDSEWNIGTAEMATLALDFVSKIKSSNKISLANILINDNEMAANTPTICPFKDPKKSFQESEHKVSETYHGCFAKWDDGTNNVIYERRTKNLTYGTNRTFETYSTFGLGLSSSSSVYDGLTVNLKPNATGLSTYPGAYFDGNIDYSFWIKLPALLTRRLDNVKVTGLTKLTYSLTKNISIGENEPDSIVDSDLISKDSKTKTQVVGKEPSISCYHKCEINTPYYLVVTKNGTTKPSVKITNLEISYK